MPNTIAKRIADQLKVAFNTFKVDDLIDLIDKEAKGKIKDHSFTTHYASWQARIAFNDASIIQITYFASDDELVVKTFKKEIH